MGSLLRRNCHLINPCHVRRSLQNQRNQLRLLCHHCQQYHHPYPRSCRSCHPPSSRSRIHWKRHHLRMGKDQGNWNRKQHSPNHPPMGRTHNPSVSEAHPLELVPATETLVAQWSKPMPTESPGLSETPHGEHHHVTPAHTHPSTPRTQLLLTGSNNNCKLILLALFFTINK